MPPPAPAFSLRARASTPAPGPSPRSLDSQRFPSSRYADRTAAVWAALTLDLLRFFRERPAHAAKVRVYNPTQEDDGWEGTHTVIQIVNDDMPFLVDTVSMAIAQDNTLTHLILHPVVKVQRDPGGHILGFGHEDGVHAESIMHIEAGSTGRSCGNRIPRVCYPQTRGAHSACSLRFRSGGNPEYLNDRKILCNFQPTRCPVPPASSYY